VKLAGVTGTNGKTTTTFLIQHICEKAGLRCGLIGTVRYQIGERLLPAARTTPESLDLQELLAQIANAGCRAVAMEVSSHALAQDRTRGLEWDVAVFTNLTQDHLDFHGTMENYFESKAKLFAQSGHKQIHCRGPVPSFDTTQLMEMMASCLIPTPKQRNAGIRGRQTMKGPLVSRASAGT
jgi:UDP-N-acetylmuramoyl-L-alanyl-D-glutamate--2,6-diaminopimelate ligase